MNRREFLQLAHVYKGQSLSGWFWSRKMDGNRCWWDGGISRGLPKKEIPWANQEKDERYVRTPLASGLWSRSGNVIHAPDRFIDGLPRCSLDGELYCHGMSRQDIHSMIKPIIPGDWQGIRLHVVDLPPIESVLTDGRINTPNFSKTLFGCVLWAMKHGADKFVFKPQTTTKFIDICGWAPAFLAQYDSCSWVKQTELPYSVKVIHENLPFLMRQVTEEGYEGMMLRHGHYPWVPTRTHNMLKYKPTDDCEVTVIGYISGTGKLLGLMGAVEVRMDDGRTFEVSGFTDQERELHMISYLGDSAAYTWAANNPKTRVPDQIYCPAVARGTRITIRHRGFTDAGIPQEARYWRKDERI